MNTLFALIIILIGVLNVLFPQAAWYLRAGWQFKNAEPSDAALIMGRVSGVIAILIGIVFLFP
ncbi:DUF6199 family natural product biosynthesis protein [Tumebacillus flagellatus]|uniref:DUF6199 domain-containing protein n=1 Tax=Tumebacillus flagellatus TaxID=1157490 RepID=A0A074LT31_9BACL|nr:DUF6199 family natural product biosynthesis protein [Tumebacillus flagellatus]KEO84154.1 hypothetical protein EL26_06725 [Tumebacillus flagellatus]